jgi:hypothetical protein
MGKWCIGLWLSVGGLLLAGCQAPNPLQKPKMHPEYVLPPTDDSRFSSPPTYPKEVLDTGQFKKEQSKPPDQQKDSGTLISGPGGRMGGY